MEEVLVLKALEVLLVIGLTVLLPYVWKQTAAYYKSQREARARTEETVGALIELLGQRRAGKRSYR